MRVSIDLHFSSIANIGLLPRSSEESDSESGGRKSRLLLGNPVVGRTAPIYD